MKPFAGASIFSAVAVLSSAMPAASPEEFAACMRRDREIAGEIIRKFNIPRQ